MAKRCEVCKIDLSDEYAYQGHLSGKKHANNLKFSQLKKGIEERSIFVSNWPPHFTQRDLIDFFLQYGPIERHRFEREYALVQFTNRAPVELLTSSPIVINNYRLRIKPRIFYENKRVPVTQAASKLSYEDFRAIFEGETTFDSQLIAFLNAIQHSDVVVEGEYGSVCASLYQIFRTKFRNCKVHRYGSTVTGLSFKKSDVDVYVDIGSPIRENEEEAKPEEWTPKKVFRAAKSLLFKHKNIFTDIVLIPNAKTPIIKFRHAPTNIFCDISFKNSLGVCNSQLIKHYLSLDVRLKPLVIIIKFWAQLSGIAGTGKISNYALTMLIIFFLQQPERAIVPTVLDLQTNCTPEFVQGWQVNYDKNIKFQYSKNESTLPQLLYEFFDFYAAFDFTSKVICPLDGRAHPKTIFSNAEELPDTMFRYSLYMYNTQNPVLLSTDKPMCIQDPIELNHNLTLGIIPRAVEYFQQHCVTSRDVCTETQENDYKNFLSLLFSRETIVDKHTRFKITIKGETFLKFGLPPSTVLLPNTPYRGELTIDDWYDTVLNLTKETFERVLKFEVKLGSMDREAKQQKCEVQSDVHSKDNTKIVLECSGFLKLWYGRKSKKPVFDPTLSFLDKEARISEMMVEELKKTPASSVPIINFSCIFEKQQKPISVSLTITNNNSVKSTFREFSAFIQSKLPLIIDKTLLHMLQFKKLEHQSSSQE